MSTQEALSRPQSLRVRVAALGIGALSAAYAALSAAYFYEDFFRYAPSDLRVDPAGIGFHVSGMTWSYLGFFRIPMALLAVAMLAASAAALWRSRPRARILTLITLWGVLLPQVLWQTEFLADWHEGRGIPAALAAALALVLAPTLLLMGRGLARKFEGQDTLTGWATLSYGRARLLACAVGLAWLGFAATEFIDHANRLPSDLAIFGALMTLITSTAAVVGIVRLRAWALWAGVAATLFVALIPLAALWTPYQPNVGWHINEAFHALAGHDLQRATWTLAPLGLLWIIAGPFLHEFLRKLRG